MAAPLGNEFWKLRSKHGRDKLFATPELLWEAACEYFEWINQNPLQEEQLMKIKVSRDTEEIRHENVSKKRPYTLIGLCLYCGASATYWKEFRSNCVKNKEVGFLPVITRVEEIIYNQKFEGAAAGFFNPTIISRDLGLADKKEITGEKQKIIVKYKKSDE